VANSGIVKDLLGLGHLNRQAQRPEDLPACRDRGGPTSEPDRTLRRFG